MSPTDIKAIRYRLNVSQEAFARMVGVSTQTVHRWERKEAHPKSVAVQERIREIEKQAQQRGANK